MQLMAATDTSHLACVSHIMKLTDAITPRNRHIHFRVAFGTCSWQMQVKHIIWLQSYTGQSTLGDAMISLLQQLPKVQWIITTLGKKGSVLVQRSSSQAATEAVVLEDKLNNMLADLSDTTSESASRCNHGDKAKADCISKSQVSIWYIQTSESATYLAAQCCNHTTVEIRLLFSTKTDTHATLLFQQGTHT